MCCQLLPQNALNVLGDKEAETTAIGMTFSVSGVRSFRTQDHSRSCTAKCVFFLHMQPRQPAVYAAVRNRQSVFRAVTNLSWLLLYKPGRKVKIKSCTGKQSHAQLINLHPKRKFCKVLGKSTFLRQFIESRLKVKH